MTTANVLELHANAVVFSGKACLITGPSGSGKSSLSLSLMSLGAELVADDRCRLTRVDGRIVVSAPEKTKPAIEARGVGILSARLTDAAPLELIIDLARAEPARLPPARTQEVLGLPIPCFHKPESAHFHFAIRHYLLHGFAEI